MSDRDGIIEAMNSQFTILAKAIDEINQRLARIESRQPAKGQGPLTEGEYDRIKAIDPVLAALKASEEVERG